MLYPIKFNQIVACIAAGTLTPGTKFETSNAEFNAKTGAWEPIPDSRVRVIYSWSSQDCAFCLQWLDGVYKDNRLSIAQYVINDDWWIELPE